MIRRAAAAPILAALGAAPGAAEEEFARLSYGRRLASECTSCHRPDGVQGAIPSIAGRPEAEFTEQGAYLDDPDAAANREACTRELLEALAREVEP